MKTLRSRGCLILCFATAAACARHRGTIGASQFGNSPLFETRIEIATGSGTHADYDVADFNGDGALDMAVVSLTGELRILLSNGTDLVQVQDLTPGGGPIWIAGGDFDRDGDRDLVVVRNFANETQVYTNDGGGNFALGASLPAGADALAVVVADRDQDGDLDVLISRPIAPEIVIFDGDGAGGFVSGGTRSLPGGGSPFNLQIGDVTNDLRPDLIVADPLGSRVLIYKGEGAPTDFGETPFELSIPGSPRAVAVGDLNGDGRNDMAVSAFEANRFVIVTDFDDEEPGPATYTAFAELVEGAPSVSTIADVDGDGLADLVACLLGRASMVVVPQLVVNQIGKGGSTLGEQIYFDATGLPLRPFVGDFDRNGRADMFALSGLGDRVNLWLARGDGELVGARNYATNLETSAWLAGGDFDGDGDNEIVAGGNSSRELAFLGRRGSFGLEVEFAFDVGHAVFQVDAVDLDMDGLLDLVVPVGGGLKVLRNRSTPGTYEFELVPGAPGALLLAGNGPFGSAVADFDRDGDLDIAVVDFRDGNLHLVRGTAQPFTFEPAVVVQVGGGPVAVVAADFTGDQWIDLAISRANQADILILRNDGNGGFVDFLNLPVGTAPNYLVTADFDRDQRADLVVSNGSSESITVLFGRPAGFVGTSYPAGRTPTALLANDLSGDGLPDILVASLVDGDFHVLVGDGRGSFPELSRFPGTLGASDALLQDMDGDGRPDLAISSLMTGRVSLVKNITQ